MGAGPLKCRVHMGRALKATTVSAGGLRMEITLINLVEGFIRFECGYSVPIVAMFDGCGDDCGPQDALAITVGPLPGDGMFVSMDLAQASYGAEAANCPIF